MKKIMMFMFILILPLEMDSLFAYAIFMVCLSLLSLWRPVTIMAEDWPLQQAEMAGYLLIPHEKVPESYNAGFSMYVAAWPRVH